MSTLNALWVSAWMLTAPTAVPETLPIAAPTPQVSVVTPVSYNFEGSVSDATLDGLTGRLRRLAEDEARLGDRRRRRLWVARSHLVREELGALPHNDLRIEEEIEDIVGHCVTKLLRSRFEEKVGYSSLRQRYDERREGSSEAAAVGRRWSVSPRVGVGHDPWLGSKLRWRMRGEAPTWRRPDVAFGLKRHLLHDEVSFAMEIETQDLELQVEHINDAEHFGDVYQMSLRWRF